MIVGLALGVAGFALDGDLLFFPSALDGDLLFCRSAAAYGLARGCRAMFFFGGGRGPPSAPTASSPAALVRFFSFNIFAADIMALSMSGSVGFVTVRLRFMRFT